MKNKFLIIGGDLRQVFCAKELERQGFDVTMYGFFDSYIKDFKISNDIEADIANSDYILLPLPLTIDNENINTPLWEKKLSLAYIYKNITDKTIIFGGIIKQDFLQNTNISKVFDYTKNDEFLIKNAKLTVEGAFNIIFQETLFSVYESNILVIGYGRIGKILASTSQVLGAKVSVSARKIEDLAWISVNGFEPVRYSNLKKKLSKFNIVINTVPSLILDKDLIYHLNKDCLLLDLASKPGGIDIEVAKKAGIKTIWALSLPGKTAPLSSGKIISDTILNLIQKDD
jgi:dipicolinate synthase subunit A